MTFKVKDGIKIVDNTITSSGNDLLLNGSKIWTSTNDGAGSGLDANLFDGLTSTDFIQNNGSWDGGSGSPYTTVAASVHASGDTKFTFYGTSGAMDVITDGNFYANEGSSKVWHEGNDGAGSGLDADKLDGQHGSSFLRSDTDDAMYGNLSMVRDNPYLDIKTSNDSNAHLRFQESTGVETSLIYSSPTGDLNFRIGKGTQTHNFNDDGTVTLRGDLDVLGQKIKVGSNTANGAEIELDSSNAGSPQINMSDNDGDNRWAIGADDADNNFAIHGSTTVLPTINNITNPHFEITTSGVLYATGNEIWHAGNDGPSSGLDADTIHGIDGPDISRIVATASATVGGGWMTVASTSSSRKYGEVTVHDKESGDHSFIRLDWMRSYADTNVTVLQSGGHSRRIQGVRVLNQSSDTTYGNKYLQVYVTTNSNYYVNVYSHGNLSGWSDLTVVTPVIENTKSGYATQGGELNNLDNVSLASTRGIASGTEIYAQNNQKVYHDNYHPYSDDSNNLDGISSGSFLRSDTTDYLNATMFVRGDIRNETGYRDHGMYGDYHSEKTNHIWSMGSGYRNDSNGSDFGNLYGLAYKHTNNGTGGTMAGSHQMVWCHSGNPKSAMGTGIWTSGNVTAYSDIRVKENLEIIPNAVNKISKINGYTYDRTDIEIDELDDKYKSIHNPKNRYVGLIAQEVLEVLPEAVTGGPTTKEGTEEEHYSVAYGNVIALLVEGIKEQQESIKEQQESIKEQHKTIASMQNDINILKNKDKDK
jgi:hypothetical protein